MTKRKTREYGGYQIIGSSKYARFYAMYDLFRIREPEYYSGLTEMQKTIVDEDILDLSEIIQPKRIPERIKNTYRVIVGMDRIRELLVKDQSDDHDPV